jgi:hypothetical protein
MSPGGLLSAATGDCDGIALASPAEAVGAADATDG